MTGRRRRVRRRTSGGLAWDAAGDGPPVVLVHAGVADRGMWDPVVPPLTERFRVVRYDARGFGDTEPAGRAWSHATDLAEVIDEVVGRPAAVVGVSMGAGTAVELALERPEVVTALVLAAPGGSLLSGPGEALRAAWREEGEALERGDLDAAVEANLRAWVDGPRRAPDDVDPDLRARVGGMQRRALEKPGVEADAAFETGPEPPALERLADLRVVPLVVVGELDLPDVVAAAERLAREVPGTRLERWSDAGHLPSIEHPDRFARLLLDVLPAS